jgi:hypothetical protein
VTATPGRGELPELTDPAMPQRCADVCAAWVPTQPIERSRTREIFQRTEDRSNRQARVNTFVL